MHESPSLVAVIMGARRIGNNVRMLKTLDDLGIPNEAHGLQPRTPDGDGRFYREGGERGFGDHRGCRRGAAIWMAVVALHVAAEYRRAIANRKRYKGWIIFCRWLKCPEASRWELLRWQPGAKETLRSCGKCLALRTIRSAEPAALRKKKKGGAD